MSSLFCFVDFMWRYHGLKGVPDSIVEDGGLTIWRPPWTWRRVLRTITLRVQAYRACSTSHYSPSASIQCLLFESLGAGGVNLVTAGKLADLLNNSTIHVLYPHAHVIFWCVPRIPHARGDIQTLCNILSHSPVLPIAALPLFWVIL